MAEADELTAASGPSHLRRIFIPHPRVLPNSVPQHHAPLRQLVQPLPVPLQIQHSGHTPIAPETSSAGRTIDSVSLHEKDGSPVPADNPHSAGYISPPAPATPGTAGCTPANIPNTKTAAPAPPAPTPCASRPAREWRDRSACQRFPARFASPPTQIPDARIARCARCNIRTPASAAMNAGSCGLGWSVTHLYRNPGVVVSGS